MNLKRSLISLNVPPMPRAEYVLGLFRISEWISRYGTDSTRVFEKRPDLYRWVAQDLLGGGPVSYLEFGVFTGASLRFWTDCNQHAESRFFGFDTFEGLPEDWNLFSGRIKSGAYSAGGTIPQFEDPRVHLFKGLFQDTLLSFLASTNLGGQLVLHMDADLYSSTMFVLARMHSLLSPGTVLIFDEFNGPLDEFRAWEDYVHSHMRKYECLAQRNDYEQVVLRLVS